jgi:hypothetical protein
MYRCEDDNIKVDSTDIFCKGVELLRAARLAGCRMVWFPFMARRDKAACHWSAGPSLLSVGRKVMLLEVTSMIAKLLILVFTGDAKGKR